MEAVAAATASLAAMEQPRRPKENSYNAIKEQQQRFEMSLQLHKNFDSSPSHYDPKSNIERGNTILAASLTILSLFFFFFTLTTNTAT